ncbi:hypothetical protein EP47_09285 [Legionella norrlandica]|uniref:SH2 domain-containing protein n=1 Tax=Legionella norrlandica TaxID=1498499 RepID=A0A0A2SQ98_9GAMM|nr:hypothetical protein [Legionella norrlandica]KGP63315.1 hypothetical protein EP47_09285 [Legionella norrlandica]
MESKAENQTVIFSSETDAKKACLRLDKEGAPQKEDKAVWLLRESSVPGLLTITYFNHEKDRYVHIRIGFVGNKWEFGPSDFYKAIEFSKRAEAAFSKALPPKSFESLVQLLSDYGYNLNKQLIPKSNESSQNAQYTGYTANEFTGSTSTNRYTPFD